MTIRVNGEVVSVEWIVAEVEHFARGGKRGQRVYYFENAAGQSVKLSANAEVEVL